MKPIRINLSQKKDAREKTILGVIFLFIALAVGMTLSNIYDYYSNWKIVAEYQQRLAAIQQKSKQMEMNLSRTSPGEQEAIRKATQLQPVLEKHFVSLPAVLTELENLKPEKLKFDEISFFEYDKKYAISISGSSDNTEAVFQFLSQLNSSPKFTHTLSQEKLTGRKKIEFKLTAEWLHEANI
ncbi:MAG: PilN domain-containing protein [Desulfobacter sp.]|nr:MAG: PilN domain-containing protein [Desulfobacter sp.]